ncbi:MAG: UbiA family prenyltransferase [Deltaproteobacteria bacterium]|nr:UbiA family prenyltransferase [Deltaproteobacteria bacterium]
MTTITNPLSHGWRGLINIFSLIKFSHTIFALPFALSSMLVAASGIPPLRTILFIIIGMVAGRTAGIAFNRYLDAEIDAKNPRTALREIPRGVISKRFALILSFTSSAMLLLVAFQLNSLCFYLSPLALFLLYFYSFTKRLTDWSHLFVGLVLGITPIASWIAVTGSWSWIPFILGLGVTFWVAGFDIIYATQDEEFDRREGLHSLVVRLGLPKALWIARLFHGLTLLSFIAFGYLVLDTTALPYWLALSLCGFLLFYEHRLVKPTDLSHVNAAFFNMNGTIAIIFFAGVAVSIL